MYKSIILSGYPGAGKSALAAALSKEYGWPVYSIGGLWRDKYKTYKDAHPEYAATFEEFWSKTTIPDNLAVNEDAKLISEKENVIFDSRYTKSFNGEFCLFVFVTADIDIRVKRVHHREEYKALSVQELVEVLKRREKDEVAMGQKLYGANYDYRDPQNYAIVIDSRKMTVAQEVEKIRELMRK